MVAGESCKGSAAAKSKAGTECRDADKHCGDKAVSFINVCHLAAASDWPSGKILSCIIQFIRAPHVLHTNRKMPGLAAAIHVMTLFSNRPW